MTKEQIYEYKKGDFTLPPAFDFNCFIGDYHCKIPKVYKEQLNYARKWIKDNVIVEKINLDIWYFPKKFSF